MAFIDELKFHASAGKGGDGVVRWRHEKFIDRGGPNGGNGGKGGNIYIRAVQDSFALAKIKHKKQFDAMPGFPGEGASRHGKDGESTYIELPVGSVVTNLETGWVYELLEAGQEEMILSGGDGGKGNEHFKNSVNQAPKKATPGYAGGEGDFHVELKLFADVGLIGFPNAGKSSLLNMVTRSQAKIGDYAFTTLDPNLGDFYGHIIADIPGLIEGASEDKGLGTKFLRHVSRTKMLAHLISFENYLTAGATGMTKAYKVIREELKSFGSELDTKDEIIILTKTDLVDEAIVKKEVAKFEKLKKVVFALTLYDDASIKKFTDSLSKMLAKKDK